MKIIVSATLGGGSAGTWYAIETAKRLQARGHQLWYLSRSGHSALERARSAGLTTVDNIDLEGKSLSQTRRHVRDLTALARLHTPDVVLAHGGEDHLFWALARKLHHLKFKLVRVRALDPKPPKKHLFARWLHRRATDFIVTANSRHFAAYHDRLRLPVERLRIIEAGIDPADFADTSDAAMAQNGLSLPAGKPIVVMVARFATIKGHRVLLSAAGMLKRRGVNCHLLWVGYPKEYPAEMLQRWLVEANLLKEVTIIDKRLPQLPALLARCQLGVIASVGSETVSRSLLEYFACGLPVVATDVGGIPDLMGRGDFGRLVPPDNATALADGIADLLSDDQRRLAMGLRAREYVFTNCTWDQRTDQWEQLLKELVPAQRL
jgi:glycosyltransferase involved in cell wall biosynthesis